MKFTLKQANYIISYIFFGIIVFLLGFTADKLSPAYALFFLQILQLANLWVYWKLFKHDKIKSS